MRPRRVFVVKGELLIVVALRGLDVARYAGDGDHGQRGSALT